MIIFYIRSSRFIIIATIVLKFSESRYFRVTTLHYNVTDPAPDTLMPLWKIGGQVLGFWESTFSMFSCIPVNFIRQKSGTSLTFSLRWVQFLLE